MENEKTSEETDLQDYKDFLDRYQQAKNDHQEYSDIFDIIIVSKLQSNIRLKADKKCKVEQTIEKLNKSLEFLSKLNLHGVKKLEIEVKLYEYEIQAGLIKSFLTNLSNINSVNNIQINEFLNKKMNPYTFTLFMSYEPKIKEQIYSYTNYSKGRKTIMTVKISPKDVIKQVFEFKETVVFEADCEAVQDLKQFYKQLYEVSKKIEGPTYFIRNDSLQKQKSVEVIYDLGSSLLKTQSESILDYLRLQNEDTRIKHITLKIQAYSRDKAIGEPDLSEFCKLEIFKKFKLKIESIYSSDVKYLKQYLSYIKGLGIKNSYTSSSLNFESLLQFESNNNEIDGMPNTPQVIPYENKNFTTLKFIDFGSNEIYLGQQFQLIDSFPNIQKVLLQSSQSINRYSVYGKYKDNIIRCIDSLRSFFFQRIFVYSKGVLSLNLQRLNFHNIPFEFIQQIILSIQRSFSLNIESYNTVLMEEKSEQMSGLLKEIAFKTNIVSLKVCPSIYAQFKRITHIVWEIKQFSLQGLLFNILIRQHMTYNPDHIFQDLFDFE